MIDAVQDVVVTRTMRFTKEALQGDEKEEDFTEFMTADAGGWSNDPTRAFKFSAAGAKRALRELKVGRENDKFCYRRAKATE